MKRLSLLFIGIVLLNSCGQLLQNLMLRAAKTIHFSHG